MSIREKIIMNSLNLSAHMQRQRLILKKFDNLLRIAKNERKNARNN